MAQQYDRSQQSGHRRTQRPRLLDISSKVQQRQMREFTLNSLRKNKKSLVVSQNRTHPLHPAAGFDNTNSSTIIGGMSNHLNTPSLGSLNSINHSNLAHPCDAILSTVHKTIIDGLVRHAELIQHITSTGTSNTMYHSHNSGGGGGDTLEITGSCLYLTKFNRILAKRCLNADIVDRIATLCTRYDNIEIQNASLHAFAHVIQLVKDWKQSSRTDPETIIYPVFEYLMKNYTKFLIIMEHIISFLGNDTIYLDDTVFGGGLGISLRLRAIQCVGNLLQLYILYCPNTIIPAMHTTVYSNTSRKVFKTCLTWITNISSDITVMSVSIFKNKTSSIQYFLLETGWFLSSMVPCVFYLSSSSFAPTHKGIIDDSLNEHGFVECLLEHMAIVAAVNNNGNSFYNDIFDLWHTLSDVMMRITEKSMTLFPVTAPSSSTSKPITKLFIVDRIIRNPKLMDSLISILSDSACKNNTMTTNLYICGSIIGISYKHCEIMLKQTPFIRILINLFNKEMQFIDALIHQDEIPSSMYDDNHPNNSSTNKEPITDAMGRLKLMVWIISNIAAGSSGQIAQLFDVALVRMVVNMIRLITSPSVVRFSTQVQKSPIGTSSLLQLLTYAFLTIKHIVTEGTPHFIHDLVECYNIIPLVICGIDQYKNSSLEITSYCMGIISACLSAGVSEPHTSPKLSNTHTTNNSLEGFRLCGAAAGGSYETMFVLETGWHYGKELELAGGIEIIENLLDHPESLVYYYAQEIVDILDGTYKMSILSDPENLCDDIGDDHGCRVYLTSYDKQKEELSRNTKNPIPNNTNSNSSAGGSFSIVFHNNDYYQSD
jgi:hypothetical protein